MWSRKFCLVGLASSVAVALLVFAAIFFVLRWAALREYDLVARSVEAGIAVSTGLGVLAYPICWLRIIQRSHSYSIDRTVKLIILTYALSCLIAGAIIWIIIAFYGLSIISLGLTKASVFAWSKMQWRSFGILVLLILFSPFEAAIPVIMGVVFTIVPYALLALPFAFIHRWFLMAFFKPADPSPSPAG